MVDETDGVEEAREGQVPLMVTAGGQVDERMPTTQRVVAARTSDEQATDTRISRPVGGRTGVARAEVRNGHQSDWWDLATSAQIGCTYQTAHPWSEDDAEAPRAEQHVRHELRHR